MRVWKLIVGIAAVPACLWLLRSGAQSVRERADSRRSTQSGFPVKGRLATAQKKALLFDGIRRYYLVQPVDAPGPHPVVIFLHGGTQTAEQVWTQTSLPTLGTRERFIVVAPNAVHGHWNDGRGAVLGGGRPSTADDVGFLQQVIEDVVANTNGDRNAVFMIGTSNGGFMTMRFACDQGGLLRAGGNLISDLPAQQRHTCKSTKPLPWISMNGTEDHVVPFVGLPAGAAPNGQPHPELISADATFNFWAKRAGCSSQVDTTMLPHLDPSDPTSAERRVRTHCHGGPTSVQYVFHGAGHMPPNLSAGLLATRVLGLSNFDVDAGEAIWDHFRQTLKH